MILILPSGVIIDWTELSSISIDFTRETTQYYFITNKVKTQISKEDYTYLSQFQECSPDNDGRLRE
jgi:hypothetical protein